MAFDFKSNVLAAFLASLDCTAHLSYCLLTSSFFFYLLPVINLVLEDYVYSFLTFSFFFLYIILIYFLYFFEFRFSFFFFVSFHVNLFLFDVEGSYIVFSC